jgi:phage-related protein
MSEAQIIFYRSPNGREPVREFLDELDSEARAFCLRFVQKLISPGPLSLTKQHVEQVRRGIWELKPSFRRVEYRIFYAQLRSGQYILLHAVKKKRQRLPASVFDLAEERLGEWRERHSL